MLKYYIYFFFTYLYGLVKIRQLFMRESTIRFFKKVFIVLNTVIEPTRPSCILQLHTIASYVAIIIFAGDGILLPHLLGYKTEVWLLSTETVKLDIINCSACIRGYSHYGSYVFAFQQGSKFFLRILGPLAPCVAITVRGWMCFPL